MKGLTGFSNTVSGCRMRRTALFIAMAGSALTAMPAIAQESGLVLEEVIVTATKRETSLMDTGISITAFSSEKLQEFGIDDLNDLSRSEEHQISLQYFLVYHLQTFQCNHHQM